MSASQGSLSLPDEPTQAGGQLRQPTRAATRVRIPRKTKKVRRVAMVPSPVAVLVSVSICHFFLVSQASALKQFVIGEQFQRRRSIYIKLICNL